MRKESLVEAWGTPAFKELVAVENSAEETKIWHEMEEEKLCRVTESESQKRKVLQAGGWPTGVFLRSK